MAQKTALYDKHLECGARMVEYAGFEMPVQYSSGISTEHMAVRTAAGLFDVSHMGEILFEGKDACAALEYLLTNRFENLAPGRVRYAILCDHAGKTVDDLIVYCYSPTRYLVVVNAANKDKDFTWMQKQLAQLPDGIRFSDLKIEDLSSSYSLLALQGPASQDIMLKLLEDHGASDKDLASALPQTYYSFVSDAALAGVPCMISRTGYTGEFGYEIYLSHEAAAQDVVKLWDSILEAGREFGCIPCGLGARDTLRLEAAMPLYGHELSENIGPIEAGLDFALKFDKLVFIGKEALEEALHEREQGKGLVRVGLEVCGRGIVREGAKLFLDEEATRELGFTSSGTMAPYLSKAIAMAYLPPQYATCGVQLFAQVRSRMIEVRVCELPFYKKA